MQPTLNTVYITFVVLTVVPRVEDQSKLHLIKSIRKLYYSLCLSLKLVILLLHIAALNLTNLESMVHTHTRSILQAETQTVFLLQTRNQIILSYVSKYIWVCSRSFFFLTSNNMLCLTKIHFNSHTNSVFSHFGISRSSQKHSLVATFKNHSHTNVSVQLYGHLFHLLDMSAYKIL